MSIEISSPRGDVATSPAIVAALTVALGALDDAAECDFVAPTDTRWRAAGRTYDAYDRHVSAERRL